MLSVLGFLLYGEFGNKQKKLLTEASCFYLISKNKPIRDSNGEPLSKKALRDDIGNRLEQLKMKEFKAAVDLILDKLESLDGALYYFVLVSTFHLPDEKFEKSLKKLAVEQNLVTLYNGDFVPKLYSEPLIRNGVPQLAWDISPVLDRKYLDVPFSATTSEASPTYPDPIDSWGLLSTEFRAFLKNEPLMLSAKEDRPIEFFQLTSKDFWKYLINMYQGKSSHVFQLDGMSHFYQAKPCQVENWNLTKTKSILQKHLYLANLLAELQKEMKQNVISMSTENQIRWMVQEYVRSEQYIYWQFLETIINENNQIENKEIELIIRSIPSLEIGKGTEKMFEISDKLYEITSGFYNVLKEMSNIFIKINDYSPINLNEKSYIGTQLAPHDYSKRMWRRLNVKLTKFIVREAAKMLTSAEAELFELLTDAVDVKLIRDPSVWQRLNPLKMESSIVMDAKLADKLVDLIIGYRFFINDKKMEMIKFDMNTFAKSDIQDAKELELFAKSTEFENMIDEILKNVDQTKISINPDELSNCIEQLIDKLPTEMLVEKYSLKFLKDSRRFFEFLKKFFTTAYIHANKADVLNVRLLASLDDKKIRSLGYDPEFFKSIAIDLRSSFEDQILHVTPDEPMNVYLSDGIVSIYSQIYTIMNMLQTALNAVIETHNCETLRHEPRLRYAFFHMNTTVFAIRKNMMCLIEGAYETMMKETNFEKSKIDRNAHDWLNICYKAHRHFMREVAMALMLSLNRGSTSRIIKMMVGSVSFASKLCMEGDAVGTERYYQQFLTNLNIFLDQCRLDRNRYVDYRSLEMGDELADRKSTNSSYSDDISCRSY